MANPVIRFWEFDNSAEALTKTFASCDAGAYEPAADPWWKIKIWNDKGGVEGSIKATSLKITVRDSDGGTDELWTKQGWIEIKSSGVQGVADATIAVGDVDIVNDQITVTIDIPTGEEIKFTTTAADLPDPLVVDTIYYAIRVDATTIKVASTLALANAGTAIVLTDTGTGTHTVTVYLADDAMANFQAVGLNMPLSIGDIPKGCNRTLYVRCHPPTDALENAGITFVIRSNYQEPSTTIAKWFTGLFGDGVVNTGNKLEVTDNAGADSVVDIASGWALINNQEVYFGSSQSLTLSVAADTYKVYLTHTGVIGSTTGAIPDNSIQLASVVIAGAVVSSVIDTRPFIFDSLSRNICQHFQDILAAVADGIHAAIAGTGAAQDISAGITNPDYARNMSITATNVGPPAGVVTITGLVRGVEDTDAITIVAGGIAYGVKAFDTVTNINLPAGVTAADTVTVGFSDKIGLSNTIAGASAVYKKKVNTLDETHELAGNVNATYYTVDCGVIVNHEDMEIRYLCVMTL